jgi:hypothetical protein
LRRTAYDGEQAEGLFPTTDYPAAAEFAEDFVLHPTGPDEATEEFEQMAAKEG